ncbi:MAG: type II secretion system protein GspL [Aeromonas sp.]
MSETLVIRLGTHQHQPVPWLVCSELGQAIIASGTLPSAHALTELQTHAAGRPVITLVPGCDLIFSRVTLPGRYHRRSAAALPYLLEEQVASDVDTLHLVVLAHDGPRVDLLAVDRQKIGEWLGWLKAAGLNSLQLLPDVLALPPAADGWSALQLGEEWVVRQGPYSGIVADEPLLALLLATWPEQGREPASIHCHTQLPAIANSHTYGSWQAAEPALPMLRLAKGALASSVNLLAGPYRSHTEYGRYWRQWRKVTITAGLLLLLALGQRAVHLYQLTEQNKVLKAQISEVYTRIFPGERRIVNVRSQMTQHLRQMGLPHAALQQTALPQTNQQQSKLAESKHAQPQSMLQLLTELAPAFAQVPSIEVHMMGIDTQRHELQLQITAPDFADIERFRELAGQQFEVQQGEMRSTHGKIAGSLRLKGKSS